MSLRRSITFKSNLVPRCIVMGATSHLKEFTAEEAVDPLHSLMLAHQTFVQAIVAKVMKRFGIPYESRDELIAAGNMGLVEAARRYDHNSEVSFASFAFLRIRGSVIDSIRSQAQLNSKGHRLLKALEGAHALRETSFIEAVTKGKGSTRAEFGAKALLTFCLAHHGLESTESGIPLDPESSLSKKREFTSLHLALALLPDREREILSKYYFEDKSFKEIGIGQNGATKSWICRLHARALSNLKTLLEEQQL